jgi:hypothetical protein
MNYDYTQHEGLSGIQVYRLLEMIELSQERMAGWEVVLIDRFPTITDIKVPTILGSFSWSMTSIKRKLILKHHAVDYGAGWCTPGDVARDYLKIKYPKRRVRMTTEQYEKCVLEHVAPPLYSEPCEIKDAVYIDIKSAYWSIVRAVGWDVNYMPERFLGQGADNRDFPLSKIKMARNCLVSCGMGGSMNIWTGETIISKKPPNQFVNTILWRLVQDVLNGVAKDCIEAGAKYCYTDGYIVDRRYAHDVEAAIAGWGLTSGVKHDGHCIRGPGEYKFPHYETKTPPRSKPTFVSKYYDPGNNWLRWRMYEWSKRRPEE